ncbi:hypothetical protein [Marinoscillum furvescens]|uniref:Uncharacterized protein n=1 Tax=Marinoscillum furvescens DSM 4134 TaxID=1122208 RepID=A0A3D9L715_MARFU|nr:hypothetical protein [Marinoscillum furvescens]REE02105.1 hypothetical protein C7460_102125 [Marinoscillum furvescens DSM 4134]
MKKLLILLVLLGSTDPVEISRQNKLKSKAETAFEHGQYEVARNNYRTLYDSMGVEDPAIALNLAHSYYALGDTANAKLKYQSVTSYNNRKLKSIAYQQLGVMAKTPQTLNESLQYLKAALKADPTNEGARYDYEVVKKLLDQQQENQQDQQNQDQENQDQQNEDQQNQDQENQDQQNEDQQDQQNEEQQNQDQQDQGEQSDEQQDQEQQQQDQQEGEDGEQSDEQQQQPQEGEEQEGEEQENQNMSTKEKLQEMNISEEKARMILEAMKNNEVQYIQQQRRRPTKQQDSGKPDW